MCVSGILSVANVLMSPDGDYNAQDTYDRAMPDRRAFGLSSVYRALVQAMWALRVLMSTLMQAKL